MGSAPIWLLTVWSVAIAVNISVTVASLIFVNYFRKKPIVAMGQPPMLSVLCLGALLCMAGQFFSILPSLGGAESRFSTETMDIFCSFRDWLFFIGTVTILTVLICKLYRVHKVVQFRRGQKILARHVLGPFFLIMSIAVGIMIASEIVYPHYHAVFQYTDDTGQMNTFAYCATSDSTVYVIFHWVKFLVIQLLQIGILVLAWKLRTVNEEIGDTRRVFWLCVFNTITNTIGWTVLYTVIFSFQGLGDLERFCIGALSMITTHFLYIFSSVGFLIFPRIYFVCYERIHGNLPEGLQLYGTGRVHVTTMTATKPQERRATTTSRMTSTTSSPPKPDGDNNNVQPAEEYLAEEEIEV